MEKGEGWSPIPVLGFRAWHLMRGSLFGARMIWPRPVMTAECLHLVPGEDLPHSVGRCGPPPCGIYALKEFDMVVEGLGSWQENHVLGVVAMTGKVIEHELGYRAAHSTVVAVVGRIGHQHFATDDPTHLTSLFADPVATAHELGNTTTAFPDDHLSKWKEQHESWIWARS
jgi:hypothetical protein